MSPSKINLGGGKYKVPGFLNIDSISYPEVDIVADLSKGIPLEDNSVEEVMAYSVLEHLDNTVGIMEEIYRVCKNGAKVDIIVPYFKTTGAFQDPTHKRFFTEKTFQYFDKKNKRYDFKCDFKVKRIEYKYVTTGYKLYILKYFKRFIWDVIKTMRVELEVIK
ncbi:MAG TPA: methyltransferase domain-containing protein [Candidatus Paceibacterota bacterium]